MKRIVNSKISTLIAESIKQLKGTLSAQEVQSVKSALIDIHNHKISTNNSFHKLVQEKLIEDGKEHQIADPFYNIGNLIYIPTQTGSTELLRNVYKEDNPNEDFMDYQMNVIGYVYDQVSEEL